jgi:hypothetical protein
VLVHLKQGQDEVEVGLEVAQTGSQTGTAGGASAVSSTASAGSYTGALLVPTKVVEARNDGIRKLGAEKVVINIFNQMN